MTNNILIKNHCKRIRLFEKQHMNHYLIKEAE